MKKQAVFFKSLIGVLPFLFFGTACSESDPEQSDPFLTIQEADKTIALLAEGDIKTIEVQTNISDWSVGVDAENSSWCTVSKEKKTIVISAPKNEGAERTAKITVKAGSIQNLNLEITVTQAVSGALFLTIQEADKMIAFASEAGSKTIEVKTNISDWSVSVDAANNSWCTADKGNGTIVISVLKNEVTTARAAKVSVKAGDLNIDIIVTQAAAISVQPTRTNFSITGYEGQAITINFVGNATQSLTLDEAGKGVLEPANSVRTIKSIQVSEGNEIWIGRQEPAGDINLVVNGSHEVQWRTKAGDVTTALIGTTAELLKFNNEDAEVYELESDIDLNEQPWIPFASTFSKTIDGKHHKIYNLNVDFGDLTNLTGGKGAIVSNLNGVIKNLHIASGEITYSGGANGKSVSALVGILSSSGKIIGCSNAANITGNAFAGGICGQLNGTVDTVDETQIIGCANYGNITLTGERAGGVVGTITWGTMTACYNTGNITMSEYGGGVAGRVGTHLTNGHIIKISACYNVGTVTGSINLNRTGAVGYHNPEMGTLTVEGYCYYTEGCTNGTGTETGSMGGNALVFSNTNWPTNDVNKDWGFGISGTNGAYWSSLGTPGSTTDYPKLYWE